MAILKDLIVHGVSRFLGAIYGEKFVKTGGTSSQFLKADGSIDSSTYLTTETDPTVPSWAKQSSKPSYTASEVGAYTETQVNNLLANKEDKVVSLDIGFGMAITTDGVDTSEYNKIVSAGAAESKPLLRDADGSILHVVAGDNTGEYKLMGFDDYGYVRIVTVGPGVMGSDYEILDVQSMPIEQFTESDPTVPSYVKSITQANITAWNGKQAALVSGTNIKTVNNNSLVGSGNVQVGDITGEELEGTIVDLEQSLVTNALRKTQQTLNYSEKAQVLNNLGISDVVTSGGLKTINGSSIIGTGNLEVTVVDAGDINVAQSSGDSTTYVMSQKAVTEYARRLTQEDLSDISEVNIALPDGYVMLDYISNGTTSSSSSGNGPRIDTGLLTNDENWKFEGSWCRNGSVSGYGSVFLAFTADGKRTYRIAASNGSTTTLVVNAFSKSNNYTSVTLADSNTEVWHTFSLDYYNVVIDGNTTSLNQVSADNITNNLLLCDARYPLKMGRFKAYHNDVLVAYMIPAKYGTTVGMYDVVRGQFFGSSTSYTFTAGTEVANPSDRLLSGDGLSNIISQTYGDSNIKVMSQSATTNYTERISETRELATSIGVDLRLPSGYTEVAWLSNENGADYLVTDFVPTNTTTRVCGSFRRTSRDTVTYPSIMRAYDNTNNNCFLLEYNHSNRNKLDIRCFKKATTIVTIDNGDVGVWQYFKIEPNKATINGTSTSLSGESNGGVNTQSFRLFNSAGTTHLDIGIVLIYNDTEINMCLVPCVNSSSVAGMYDVINNTFYHESLNEVVYTAGPVLQVPSCDRLVSANTLGSMVEQELGYNKNKVVSQKVITEQIEIAKHQDLVPTYFTGKLTCFKLPDYPLLNPKDCNGISLIISCSGQSGYINHIYCLFQNNSTNTSGQYFGFAHVSQFRAGLLNNYGNAVLQGKVTNRSYRTHNILTFNYNTGETKIYQNGFLTYSETPTSYDSSVVRAYLNTANLCSLNTQQEPNGVLKHLGIAVFGHVLSEDEIAEIYGGGDESVRTELIPEKYKANQLGPFLGTNWDVFVENGTKEVVEGGGYILTATDSGNDRGTILFGFTGLSGLINNCIYEWDFEIVSGTGLDIGGSYSRKMQYSQTVNPVFNIYDSNGNDVTHSDLVQGEVYHVICKPDNIKAGSINASGLCLVYYLYGTASYKMKIYPTLRVQERGAALICSNKTYRVSYWEQPNGYKLPTKDFSLHESGTMKVYHDTFIPNVKKYSNNISAEFNGQLAIDATNGKLYMGYNSSGTSSTWKQINNS